MNKKSLFLMFLLVTSPCQTFWELPAAFLFGMAVKTPTGQWAAKLIFSRCKKAWLSRKPSVKIENLSTNDSTIKSDMTKGFFFFGSALKSIASKSQAAMSSSIVAFRARAHNMPLKNPLTSSVEQSTTNHTQVNWTSCQHPTTDHHAQKAVPDTYNFVKVDDRSLNQSTSGFFPKITNNYYSGVPENVMAENGKTQFWKGVSFGGFTMGTTMAWLHSKQEPKK